LTETSLCDTWLVEESLL